MRMDTRTIIKHLLLYRRDMTTDELTDHLLELGLSRPSRLLVSSTRTSFLHTLSVLADAGVRLPEAVRLPKELRRPKRKKVEVPEFYYR